MILEVGKPFKEGVAHYMEGVHFDFTDAGANLVMYYESPTEAEVEAITKGKVQYGYFMKNEVILLFFKFGNEAWVDAPYNVHFSKNLFRLQEVGENKGYAVNIYLVDARTGILRGMRLISFSTRMSKMLRADILKQNELPWSNFEHSLSKLYQYTTNQLVKLAKVTGKID